MRYVEWLKNIKFYAKEKRYSDMADETKFMIRDFYFRHVFGFLPKGKRSAKWTVGFTCWLTKHC